jgi:hypothetical protein
MMLISKINFFQPEIWENEALLKEVERNLAVADDHLASGRWKPAIESRVFERYQDTLGGRPIESFDPDGYLAELGLGESLTAGRSNIDLLRAFHLIQEYRPDPRYFPLAKNMAAFVQKIFLVKMTERKYQTDRYHSAPYGRIEEIIKADRCDLPREARYLGILRQKVPQFAWDRGPHSGSIDPGCRANENFGTYDIALKFGFCEGQARRIATKCYDVDISQTHYHDPDDRSRLRITGTVGEIGDIQRHYNRSPAGVEDTRITAARIHLDRALQLAQEGFYDAAEQEFGIGLHSLQDIFSHAQLTPTTHTCLGVFPDLVKYHPLAMFETAVATEGYFKKFIAGLNLKPIGQGAESQTPITPCVQLVVGNAATGEKSGVSQKLAEFPKGLTAFLKNNGISIFVGAEGTKLTELGFGTDLDGDGKIMPGKWVDVNKDGKQQWFEMEDQFDNGKKWDRQPAAYNHYNRMIFIAARVLKESIFETLLKHEINHAIDLTCRDNPQLKNKWNPYIDKLYNAARRQGTIAFDELDPHEYFARIEQP